MSTYVNATSGATEHCQTMAVQFPDLAENYYNKIESYCQQKLWHQLTMIILDFVSEENKSTTLRPVAGGGDDNGATNTFLALYINVVLTVSGKINQLSLARIATSISLLTLQAVAAAAASDDINDDSKKEKLDKVYSIIKMNGPLLKQLVSDTPESIIVNSAHYESSMKYYKIVGPPEAFYNEAVDYLNYYQPKEGDGAVDIKSQTLAIDLCLAALTGEGVYNLGQVVNNPILKVLAQTPQAWLVEMLQACARGNVNDFKKLCRETYPTQIASQPALVNMGQQMQEKITLLGLIELVFTKPASERTLTFEEIATGLEIPLEQVEWVIMRAFSVKLMEGSMDEVDGTVHVTWILPRALGMQQMTDLAIQFGEWATKVDSTKNVMEETEICPQ
ncbi:hypothetical protein FRACYDRAFT_205073 [Fragilariopsis cylindrus CCMP1102]|uniref:PCI domain-containing protein n=1 Tax=Fragilariopsis cylindrus CCMP1102 TaxID=635003 RepID=A0A1E7FVG7_9STRA|nr:hypothetical protein FRACYDRAFT_205073 [Fragilariopsis cylindrus CCMP1102]|eukprot:OEU22151.1 hypothetical protein FRACYDRAFT_205073 [Fragilariopsis cylindrus CCMP1102]